MPVQPYGTNAWPKNWSIAGVAGLGKVLLVAGLTVDLLLLKDEGGVLEGTVAAGADEMLRMPSLAHGTCVRTSYWLVASLTHSLPVRQLGALLGGGARGRRLGNGAFILGDLHHSFVYGGRSGRRGLWPL